MQLQRQEQTLTSIYQNVDDTFAKADVELDEMEKLAQESLNSVVCSKANKYYAKAQAKQEEFDEKKQYVEKLLPEYEQKYNQCLELVREIEETKESLKMENTTEKLSNVSYEALKERTNQLFAQKASKVTNLVSEAKEYSNDLYNEYYPLMVQLVTGEAGADYCPDLDQYCVMGVVENRIASEKYPDTIKEVIFQDGQYQCTWDGNFYKTPTDRTKENVKYYLRGNVELGMPSDVLYQSGEPLSNDIWRYIPNGITGGTYYCRVS